MGDLTIDELARLTGFTVRNVRSHQTRGLLPGPEVRGRVGFYGEEHVARLKLIQELQDDGLPLRILERLLATRADATDRLVALRRTVLSPLKAAEATTVTISELTERFGDVGNEELARATQLGALVPRIDGTFSVPLPELLDTAERVIGQGISLQSALRVAQAVQQHCEEAARTFVDLIREEIWLPFDQAGRPEGEWPQIAAAIDEIRPLASEIFLELLPPAIAAEIGRAFGDVLREQAEVE